MELLLCYAIPQGDVNNLAHQLLEQFGGLVGVFDALPAALGQVPGVGPHTVALLKLMPLLAGRYGEGHTSLSNIITSTKEAVQHFAPHFTQGTRNEMTYLMCMDAKRKLLGLHKLGEGNVNAIDVTQRRVVELALAHNSTAVIIAHNHVSGLALPSSADLATTHQLYNTLALVGVELSDHLIFADGEVVSLRESGSFAGY